MIHHYSLPDKTNYKLRESSGEPVDKALLIKTSCNLAILIFQQSCYMYLVVGIVKYDNYDLLHVNSEGNC